MHNPHMWFVREHLSLRVHSANGHDFQRWKHTPLAEPFWRIYQNDGNSWSIVHQRRSVHLNPDSLVVAAPGTVFVAHGMVPDRHRYIHFTLDEPHWRVDPGLYQLPCEAADRAALACLDQPNDAAPRPSDLAGITGLCLRTLARLPADVITIPAHPPAVEQALAHLSRYPDRQVPNAELAALTGMNPNAFIRAFRQAVGETPQRWHQQQRIDRASMALVHTADSIDTIAILHGFCDRNHFTRVFTAQRGVAPARYRRLARGQ